MKTSVKTAERRKWNRFDVATALGFSFDYVRKLVRKGELPKPNAQGLWVPGNIRYSPAALRVERLLNASGQSLDKRFPPPEANELEEDVILCTFARCNFPAAENSDVCDQHLADINNWNLAHPAPPRRIRIPLENSPSMSLTAAKHLCTALDGTLVPDVHGRPSVGRLAFDALKVAIGAALERWKGIEKYFEFEYMLKIEVNSKIFSAEHVKIVDENGQEKVWIKKGVTP